MFFLFTMRFIVRLESHYTKNQCITSMSIINLLNFFILLKEIHLKRNNLFTYVLSPKGKL